MAFIQMNEFISLFDIFTGRGKPPTVEQLEAQDKKIIYDIWVEDNRQSEEERKDTKDYVSDSDYIETLNNTVECLINYRKNLG